MVLRPLVSAFEASEMLPLSLLHTLSILFVDDDLLREIERSIQYRELLVGTRIIIWMNEGGYMRVICI